MKKIKYITEEFVLGALLIVMSIFGWFTFKIMELNKDALILGDQVDGQAKVAINCPKRELKDKESIECNIVVDYDGIKFNRIDFKTNTYQLINKITGVNEFKVENNSKSDNYDRVYEFKRISFLTGKAKIVIGKIKITADKSLFKEESELIFTPLIIDVNGNTIELDRIEKKIKII